MARNFVGIGMIVRVVVSLTWISFGMIAIAWSPTFGLQDESTEAVQSLERLTPLQLNDQGRNLQAERDKLVATLQKIGLNEKRTDEDRIFAILLMGRVGGAETTDFLLTHLNLHLEKQNRIKDGDELKEYPCSYAIYGVIGWGAIPRMIAWMERAKRTDEELVRLTETWDRLCGARTAIAILSVYEGTKDPTLGFNVKRLLERLKKYRD